MAAHTRITFERSGGFAGISLRTKVDTDKLEQTEREAWSGLLEGVDLDALEAQGRGAAAAPDRFQYDLTIESGERRYGFTYGESALPPELKPLVERLVQEARTRPVRD